MTAKTTTRGRPRKPKQIGVQFKGKDLELHDSLVALAERDDRTVSSMVRRMLRVCMEDPTLWNLATKDA